MVQIPRNLAFKEYQKGGPLTSLFLFNPYAKFVSCKYKSQLTMEPKYKRVLLKLSGEALLGNERNGDPFNPKIIEQYANEIKQLVDFGN